VAVAEAVGYGPRLGAPEERATAPSPSPNRSSTGRWHRVPHRAREDSGPELGRRSSLSPGRRERRIRPLPRTAPGLEEPLALERAGRAR
jgi:hypothetical protein